MSEYHLGIWAGMGIAAVVVLMALVIWKAIQMANRPSRWGELDGKVDKYVFHFKGHDLMGSWPVTVTVEAAYQQFWRTLVTIEVVGREAYPSRKQFWAEPGTLPSEDLREKLMLLAAEEMKVCLIYETTEHLVCDPPTMPRMYKIWREKDLVSVGMFLAFERTGKEVERLSPSALVKWGELPIPSLTTIAKIDQEGRYFLSLDRVCDPAFIKDQLRNEGLLLEEIKDGVFCSKEHEDSFAPKAYEPWQIHALVCSIATKAKFNMSLGLKESHQATEAVAK